jgi:hypothetical protein
MDLALQRGRIATSKLIQIEFKSLFPRVLPDQLMIWKLHGYAGASERLREGVPPTTFK